jgi:hypothetical protein
MKAITLYIGLDVHKDSIVIAIAELSPVGSKGTLSGRNGVPFEVFQNPHLGLLTQSSDCIVPDNIRSSCFAASALGGIGLCRSAT